MLLFVNKSKVNFLCIILLLKVAHLQNIANICNLPQVPKIGQPITKHKKCDGTNDKQNVKIKLQF